MICLLLLLAVSATPTPFMWATPTSAPTTFVGVTPQPTPAPVLPQAVLCFQDNGGPVVCGTDVTINAGDVISIGVSNGPPTSNGMPKGPWPGTITLQVNGVTFAGLAVNQTNGLIVQRVLPGIQSLTVALVGTNSYLGAVQTVNTQ